MKINYRELVVNNSYTLRGFYTEPDCQSKQLIVFLHGHTGHKNETGNLFKQISNISVKNGYSTLRYDYFGSGDSDGCFYQQNFNTVLDDARAMIEDGYILNGNKPIILLGFSMGGAAALRMSVEKSDKIAKLVLLAPAQAMKEHLTYAFSHNDIIDDKFIDLGGYYESIDFLKSFQTIDLLENIEQFSKPVLVCQGSADLAVEPKGSKKVATLYPNAKYFLIEGATHGFSRVVYRKKLIDEIIKFMEENVD